ncbi:cupin domain-containing protein [Pigmentiphaga sp.]|jgi:Cupin domain.|uniref:cupin domain-containing protein n=1 Tax=Pigmentiphaga sp. TaxID=1977564 RepID=UPI0025F3285F|nr:cupin domain-containing protein [Pigmentiphaga sp.]MBX6317260.1 cupin domain-containing protein [Pigmentiphaga sp.]
MTANPTAARGRVRRVVTGHDETGKAIVISDDVAPFLHESTARPGFWSNDIWRTTESPARISARPEDPTPGPRRQLPHRNGSVIRVNHFPPDRQNLDPATIAREFEALGNRAASAAARGPVRHAMMHRTETIDYAVVLSGKIVMVLDDTEVELNAGDIVVQCGTNHAWSNRSDQPCTIVFILLDGAFDADLRALLEGSGTPA